MDSVEWVMNTITYDAKTSSLRVYQNGVVTDSDSFVVKMKRFKAICISQSVRISGDADIKGLVDDLYI